MSFCDESLIEIPPCSQSTCKITVIANKSDTNYKYQITRSIKVKKLELEGSIYKIPRDFCDKFPYIEELRAFRSNVHLIDKNAFDQCKSLKRLDLEMNYLSTPLHKDLFKNNKELELIVLQENGITDIDSGLFHGLKKLKTLKLHFNNLSELKLDEFDELPSLKYLYLHGNPLWYLDVDVLLHKFPNLIDVKILSQSILVNGGETRISCKNEKQIHNALIDNKIQTDTGNSLNCVKFEVWYQECKNETTTWLKINFLTK